ncbi:hypothetical protein A3D78_05010 [Candidatus Gottesmanbacteria bacterium RIFCSPHIGHO2_02_FULL_39_14]|uniref:Uncharacterized protein n=3 Tax=Candidatus Gottesmaniibacteriota TaxID=1752720 RepID=A0A1F5ZZ12_9BACT|nr:MAG: hypothetical protein A2153_05845 [Candidatus Gottesmanbacteria bacterium RBG_16_38_7b]OGG17584.1 MAG: hypothetical protein A3D78_05010 [Candidatus Gottesmanbacteria bacterium RIFCSPHIGHO2_02_FULL_39_14]OGG31084.1 MAG: hypothetical protein A3I51_02755 [Candidatus Gottesmanbacteria bacterium RIFCSPLOWO2_02_FULL_38_8]
MDSINLEKLQEFLRNKWVLGILSVLLLAVFLPLLLLTERPKQEIVTKKAIIPTVLPIPTTFMANVTSPVTFSSEQLKAIEQQRTLDETVGTREIEIRSNYPWFMKLPLRGEKYFVYFETNSKIFTGLLYPEAGDNTDQMKAEIRKKLKDEYGIPIDNFTFKWTTFE